jgi:predicted metallopeptidase
MNWLPAPEIQTRISHLISHLNFSYIDPARIYCFKSQGTTSRATARIWSLPKIWQLALSIPPGYCLEVISERFNKLSPADQEKVLIHELMHVPKSFLGGLVPHRNAKYRTFRHYHDTIESLFNSLAVKSYDNLPR